MAFSFSFSRQVAAMRRFNRRMFNIEKAEHQAEYNLAATQQWAVHSRAVAKRAYERDMEIIMGPDGSESESGSRIALTTSASADVTTRPFKAA